MLAPTKPFAVLAPPPPTPAPRPPRRPRSSAKGRVWRVVIAAAIVCMLPAIVSYAQALAQSSNATIGIRTVEWMRDNGARGLVTKVESIYYSLNAPAKGGPGLRALPGQPGASVAPASTARRVVHHYSPAPLRPVLHPALPGEGTWRAPFADAGARPPVLLTSFRSDPSYPQTVAGIAWIDHTRTSTWLYPGRLEPAVSLPRGPLAVPERLRPRLVATFNSGFKLSDSGGGFAVGGHAYAPLRSGLATLVRYRSGKVDVQAWAGGADVPPDIIYARQNLPLIVNGGRPNPNLSDGPAWGATLGNAVHVWRSAVGVDRHGNLIYAAADNQTVGSLAAVMIHAHAVRAMELDINSYWTSFITYRHGGAIGAANLLATMNRSSQRYLTPDDRDFFAVYLR